MPSAYTQATSPATFDIVKTSVRIYGPLAADVIDKYWQQRKGSAGIQASSVIRTLQRLRELENSDMTSPPQEWARHMTSQRPGALSVAAWILTNIIKYDKELPEGSEQDDEATLSRCGMRKLLRRLEATLGGIKHYVPDAKTLLKKPVFPEGTTITEVAISLVNILKKQTGNEGLRPFSLQRTLNLQPTL